MKSYNIKRRFSMLVTVILMEIVMFSILDSGIHAAPKLWSNVKDLEVVSEYLGKDVYFNKDNRVCYIGENGKAIEELKSPEGMNYNIDFANNVLFIKGDEYSDINIQDMQGEGDSISSTETNEKLVKISSYLEVYKEMNSVNHYKSSRESLSRIKLIMVVFIGLIALSMVIRSVKEIKGKDNNTI